MSESTDTSDETFENSINDESGKLSPENIPSVESDIITLNQATENMETHAHHLHHAPGKRFWHYFYEFLMLFLAVFCGFLAENQREHMIEHQKEKEYIKSFAEDLKQDTGQLKKIIDILDETLIFKDSLLTELARPEIFNSSSRAYYFVFMSWYFPDFIYTDRTIQQLKNSGSMRLIRNKSVSDSIMDYDSKVRTLFIAQQQMNSLSLTFRLEGNKLFQKRLLNLANRGFQNPPIPLLTTNKVDLEEFYNNMMEQKSSFIRLKMLDTDLLMRGARLIEFIKKQYRLG